MGDELMFRRMRRERLFRFFMYLGLVVSGIFATLYPSELVADQVVSVVVRFWATGMVLSAAICLYGALTDKWIGEFSGIPLLASVIAMYGLSAIFSGGEGFVIGLGFVILSFSAGLVARWFDVRKIKRQAVGDGREEGV